MNFDWNWFFSSFCQSAAALIGIIGAFIISRLLGLTEKISLVISQFENLAIEYNKIKSSLSKRNFYWYTKSTLEYDNTLIEAIQNGNYSKLDRTEILNKIYSEFRHIYKLDDAVMEAFDKLFYKFNPERPRFYVSGLSIVPSGLSTSLSTEKNAITQLEIEAKTLIQYFNQNRRDLNSFENTIKPLRIIIILLMISFPITVIYPLHFMPIFANQNPSITFNLVAILKLCFSLKALLLSIFFATIEAIFYYFFKLTSQLNYKLKSALINNHENFRDIKCYSQYLEED